MYAALALSWNFIGGYAGYPSFSTAGFFGLGAYAGALLQNTGLPAGFVARPQRIVAVFRRVTRTCDPPDERPLLRDRLDRHRRGPAPGGIVMGILTGGGDGLNVPILQGGPDYAGRIFLFSMMAMMIVSFAITMLVDRTPPRLRACAASRQNEDAADMVGVDVTSYKVCSLRAVGHVSAGLPARSTPRGWPISTRRTRSAFC